MGDPALYMRRFGPVLYRVLSVLDLFDMYHAWWFQFLLLLLTLNVVICSLDRIGSVWKIVRHRETNFRPALFSDPVLRTEIVLNRMPDDLAAPLAAAFRRRFGVGRQEEIPDGFRIWSERWRWTRLGVYVVHLSVVLLLLGGLIGSRFGFDGSVSIPEGQSADRIRLSGSGLMRELPFSIRCDDFTISYYDTGAPSEYRSRLTVIENGSETLQRDIVVNDPLRYRGINIFQSSFSQVPGDAATLTFTSRDSGLEYQRRLRVGEEIDLQEGRGRFRLERFIQAADFQGHPVGEAFIGVLSDAAGQRTEVILPLRFPSFDKMRRGEVTITVAAHESRYATGLQVTADPGVGVVYAGFVAMLLGCFITFFMSHQRLCIEVRREGSGSRVSVAGAANKNRLAIQSLVHRLARKMGRNFGSDTPA